MFSGAPLGQYYPGDSLLHRLDPRTKIGVVGALVVVLFFLYRWPAFAILGAVLLAGLVVAGIPLSLLWRSLRSILVLILFTFVLQLFMTPGPVWWKLGPLTATYAGLRMGLVTAGRLVLLIVATSLLTFTTSPIALTDGLEYLLRPLRRLGVPAHEIAMMMSIALRFIPTLLEEAEKIMKAQMARGADFQSGNLIRRARSMVPILVPLFVSAFRRADDLAMAMEARCYRGGEGRTRLRVLRLAPADLVVMCVSTVVVAVAVWLR
ncbi:MAG TPA: energy-coupling factor transporter transmembrane protein EcfT [Firmicutes bacterium]|nr:energy-coupling factor transporter transmembrane protein EcfT [Bacillota bacterium]